MAFQLNSNGDSIVPRCGGWIHSFRGTSQFISQSRRIRLVVATTPTTVGCHLSGGREGGKLRSRRACNLVQRRKGIYFRLELAE